MPDGGALYKGLLAAFARSIPSIAGKRLGQEFFGPIPFAPFDKGAGEGATRRGKPCRPRKEA